MIDWHSGLKAHMIPSLTHMDYGQISTVVELYGVTVVLLRSVTQIGR